MEALVEWLLEETHDLKVVGSNPSIVHRMDIFSNIFVVKIVCLFEKTKINKKRLGMAHLKKNIDTGFATLFNTQFTVKKCSIQINFC